MRGFVSAALGCVEPTPLGTELAESDQAFVGRVLDFDPRGRRTGAIRVDGHTGTQPVRLVVEQPIRGVSIAEVVELDSMGAVWFEPGDRALVFGFDGFIRPCGRSGVVGPGRLWFLEREIGRALAPLEWPPALFSASASWAYDAG